ncbi:cytochrome P450 4C1-like, partial [Phymastichus coffea]|uniref:cytochrome P450 4C1-like n=1 Tax=Phymastichus coffea TaxID=108790 RepID=UPI00273C96EE
LLYCRMPRPYMTNWMVKLDRHIGRIQKNALKVLHRFTTSVMEDRKSFHEHTQGEYLKDVMEQSELTASAEKRQGGSRKGNSTPTGRCRSRKKKLAMLDLLLVAENNGLIDREGVKEEVDTFTFEAHDTTAMAMAYTLMLLAENPEAQQLARNEVVKLFRKRNGLVSFDDLQELDYLERCIKESLRLFPPVATLMRYTRNELQLKNALIPADSHIMVHLYDTHRDPHFWQQPDRFDPDRFLPENSRNRHPFAYIPFSAGPRNCIGQKFALMELKLLIGQIIYNFRLEPIDKIHELKLMADIVLRPLNSIKLKFNKITNNNGVDIPNFN